MSRFSKNTDLRFLMNGKEINAPVGWKDINVLATFENDNVQANITVDSFDLVLEAKEIVKGWIDEGRIFEGLPFQIIAFNESIEVVVFDGFLDLANDVNILQDSQRVQVNIAKKDGLNRLDEQLQGITYGFLENKGIITDNDYVDVKYGIDNPNEALNLAFVAFLSVYLATTLENQIKEVKEKFIEAASFNAIPPFGVAVSFAFAAAKTILEIIKLRALLLLIGRLSKQIFNALFDPVRTHKGIGLQTALTKALEKIGYGFETDIPNLDNYVYLPSNNGLDSRGDLAQILSRAVIKKGIPKSSDYGYLAVEMFQLAKDYFNAKIAIRDGVVQFRPTDSQYWRSQADYTIPDVLINSQGYNTAELVGDKFLKFDTDISDLFTISEDTFKGTNYEVITTLDGVDEERSFIKGFDQTNFNVCLGSRKNNLNALDTSLSLLAGLFDTVINVFGGRSNLRGLVKAKRGILKVSQNNHYKPKLLYIEDSRIPFNQRDLLSAKHSYENYHVYDSFVEGEGQKIQFNGVRTGFGLEDFVKLIESSYFRDSEGRIAQARKIEWSLGGDSAVFDYFLRERYTENLTETKLEG